MKKLIIVMLFTLCLVGCSDNQKSCVYNKEGSGLSLTNTVVLTPNKAGYLTNLEIKQSLISDDNTLLTQFNEEVLAEMEAFMQDGLVIVSTSDDDSAEVSVKLDIEKMGNANVLAFLAERGGLAYSYDNTGFSLESALDILSMSGFTCD